MAVDEISRRLTEMRRQLDRLPETEEPPPTTLQLLGQSRQEGDWQQLLAYFLNPEAPHRLNHAVLDQFLRGLRDRDDLDFDFSRFDLDNIQVATEVPVPNGRIDLLVWCDEKWFILCELKIDAAEGDGQTQKYASAETFQNVDLDPTAVAEPRRQYLFVTPDGARPESEEFAAVDWSWIASQLRAVLDSDYGSYPVRTTSQLDDFLDTIATELTMTKHERNEAAKAELYVDYYDELAEISSAFEAEWDDLITNWGRRLATTADAARLVEDPEGIPPIPEEYVVLELPDGENRHRYWSCRQGNGQWSWLFPTDWWTHIDRDEPVYTNEKPNARVGFLHRPASDRESILANHELTFYLRNAPSGNDDFYPAFAQRFNADDTILDTLPERTERRGRKSNVLEATYPIEIDEHGSLFHGYIAALATAVDEHIVSNHALVERIDEIYQETYDTELRE